MDSKEAINRKKIRKKEKGWTPCEMCDQWRPISCECGAINEEGFTPCRVMSRKLFNYLVNEKE